MAGRVTAAPTRSRERQDRRRDGGRARSRVVAIRALVRIEEGAFANVAAARRAAGDRRWRNGTGRRSPTGSTAPCGGSGRSTTSLAPFARPRPSTRSTRRCGPRSASAPTSCGAGCRRTPRSGRRSPRCRRCRPRRRATSNAVLRRLAAAGPPWPLARRRPTPRRSASARRCPTGSWTGSSPTSGPRDAAAVLDAVNEPPPVTLRVNPRRATPDAVEAELVGAGAAVDARRAVARRARSCSGAGDLGALAAVARRSGDAPGPGQPGGGGRASTPRPGERVLEVGAAPGGKATALAEAMATPAWWSRLDVHPGRTRLIADAARRLRLDHGGRPSSPTGVALPFAAGRFDRVLLDAPCSGLGVLRRRPEARWRLQPDAARASSRALQRGLLGDAPPTLVRPGGRLVYSVCTLTRGRDDRRSTSGPPRTCPTSSRSRRRVAPWTPVGRGARLLPHVAGTDGMYCLVLRAPGRVGAMVSDRSHERDEVRRREQRRRFAERARAARPQAMTERSRRRSSRPTSRISPTRSTTSRPRPTSCTST